MKKLFIFISALFIVYSASAQVLYKISGNGLTKPSYIMGTYHFCNWDFIETVKGVKEVCNAVEQFCGELTMEEIQKMEQLQQKKGEELQKMGLDVLPDGKTFKDIFTPEQFAVINAHAKKVFGTNFDEKPESLKSIGRLMPALYSEIIQYNEIYKTAMAGAKEPITELDFYLLTIGKQLEKPTIGLETADFQFNLLYGKSTDSLKDIENQKKNLLYIIENWDKMITINNNIINAYKKQDFAQISSMLGNKHIRQFLIKPKNLYKQLLTKRDADWARRMPAIMREKSTFFFVGAFHLAGKPGVLNLLRKQGFTVEPVQ